MINLQASLAGAQIICINPIRQKGMDYTVHYYAYLKSLLRIVGCASGKYAKAQLAFYKQTLCGMHPVPRASEPAFLEQEDCFLLPFDIAAIIDMRVLQRHQDRLDQLVRIIECDFGISSEQKALLSAAFGAASGQKDGWDLVLEHGWSGAYADYLRQVKNNGEFISVKPYNVLIAATMSAGKSTLINALVGKNISLAQNMACTSKIHMIISKPFEDGVISENDHQLLLAATKEDLLSDNEQNATGKITVGTWFNGELAGKRLILIDSPGVNSSENSDHMLITQKMIGSGKYKLLIHVMNATQLATTDDAAHLKYVKDRLGRKKILFVINKADQLLSEEEDVCEIISHQKQFLQAAGFKNPVICPISARAAYLAKKEGSEGLSRLERRELDNLMDKFECYSLANYYETELKCDPIPCEGENQSLLKNSGFLYFEKLITEMTKRR